MGSRVSLTGSAGKSGALIAATPTASKAAARRDRPFEARAASAGWHRKAFLRIFCARSGQTAGCEPNMSKLITAAAAAFLFTAASVRADEQVWEMNNWPGDIDLIPCSAWSKAADGTWVLHGAVKLGSETLDNVGVKGDAAARKLDRECGARK